MVSFCPQCRRRITGGARCSCTPAPMIQQVPPVRPVSDNAERLVTRRTARTTVLVVGVVVLVTAVIVGIAVGTKGSGKPAASGPGSGTQQRFGGYATSPSRTSSTSIASSPSTASTTQTTGTTEATATGDALGQLRQYAESDFSEVSAELQDHWVAQLSSKKVGALVDGTTYDATTVLQDHLSLRSRYTDVRLIWSGDWASFKYPDYWVTVLDQPFDTADLANAWCDQQGLPKESCYAKRIRSSGGYDGNTKVR